MTHPPNVVQIGEHGALFALRPPHTLESVRASAEASEGTAPPLLCRLRHRWKTVGDVYYPDPDEAGLATATLAVVAASDIRDLRLCLRCGRVAKRFWP